MLTNHQEYKADLSKRNASLAISLARKHAIDFKNSGDAQQVLAYHALLNAVQSYDRSEYDYAGQRALLSLTYSVGALHPDYVKAETAVIK